MGRFKIKARFRFGPDGQKTPSASPLHHAVRDQLLGGISPEQAAPAIFLLAHDAFDAPALQAAALVYKKSVGYGVERLGVYLMQEAQLRAGRAGASPEHLTPTPASLLRTDNLTAVLVDLSARIGLCARVGGGPFNEGVRAAQKEVEAAILRLPKDPSPVIA